ncbi:family 43 glycosylhydrolase [Paraflavitalea sp. CAU 1676]|uniref:family 43 glycosylhydrolase n=1 Tax=Paraflavitalea sp. CAU 1676 TaxID=3032598 RepID=UPI0023DAE1C7|nr:family 43 glycosylhydrolase [Paraflavitalea sp. CAU 1676]MDF2191259.1 family 43 glycosylhydrolase [Paraflavitalea sp. CAU 1676]
MKDILYKKILATGIMMLMVLGAIAQNPLIRNMYSADPSARVFGDSVYVYPSHDILATPGHGRVGWFCMEDYHVYASKDLADWKDHGVIVTQTSVPWAKPDGYSMWAPDCIYRNGKYYFYFPATPDSIYGRGFAIGVAVADKPGGPFMPQPTPIKKVHGIDPNVFIDKDGQAYLYWSQGNIYGAKLQDNMLELASDPVIFQDLPNKGLKEGPYVFERNGLYYLTFPHVENKTERLEYAIGNSPLGPFKMTGVIMDESASGCWTNHHSVIQLKNQWYLFYHHNDYSPRFDKARSIMADSLVFNADGTIKKVTPTLRGIGITSAASDIQVDRYTAISDRGASIAFLDTADRFKGWKADFTEAGAWVQYNSVDFGKKSFRSVRVKVMGEGANTLELHSGSITGPLIARVNTIKSGEWNMIKAPVSTSPSGVQNIFVVFRGDTPLSVDWIKFE